ncbi:hypothetical protein QR680_006610 [Steinernema hermaphroditum]|uniref:EGF-like domain-containing protein n=1 Tax=Steinernema hermaphroditum TaxID=289476 RepID=A0AA39HXJ9_9BILA|nr:hypothetical protein QR680_006610 [Steinernema hermaphroditum]
MRSIGLWIGVALLCCFGHLVAVGADGVEDVTDVCNERKHLCGKGARCISAPFEKKHFICQCTDECYGGPQCDVNICKEYRKYVRFLLILSGYVLALAAIIALLVEQFYWRNKKNKVRHVISADSSQISRASTYLKYPYDEASYCKSAYSTFGAKATKSHTAMSSGTLACVPSLTSVSVISMKASKTRCPNNKQPVSPNIPKTQGRRIAWDEIEMRRHGYVNRFCRRPDLDEVDPKSIDVSVLEPRQTVTGPTSFSTALSLPENKAGNGCTAIPSESSAVSTVRT